MRQRFIDRSRKLQRFLNLITAGTDNRRGQILALFVVMAMTLLLFAGLGLDTGMLYRDKAQLSQTMDGVAVRITNQFSLTDQSRQDIIKSFLVQNGYTWGSNLSWSASANGSFTGTAVTGQQVQYGLQAFGPNNEATRATLSATTISPTYFMRLANINSVNITTTSVAERYPGIIALILDVSGSMRGDITSNSTKWWNMVNGARQFVNSGSFSETRDRLVIVTFGTRAIPIWPSPDANGNVTASHYFLSGNGISSPSGASPYTAGNALDNLYNGSTSNTNPTWGFNGATSASEGVRVAFQAVENALPQTNATDRALFRVSYVFLTDGAFNTMRSWAVGAGYGWGSGNNTTFTAGPATQNATNSTFTASTRPPSWHSKNILNVSTVSGLGWGNASMASFSRPNSSSYSGPFNLGTLFSNGFSGMPGISCTVYVPGNNGNPWWGSNLTSSTWWPLNWNNLIYNQNGTTFPVVGNGTANQTTQLTWNGSDTTYMLDPNVSGSGNNTANYTTTELARIRWEMLQSNFEYMLFMPEPIWSDSYNPTLGNSTNNSSAANMTSDWLEYYAPQGRSYANMYGGRNNTDSATHGMYFEQSTGAGGNGMTANGTFNYNGWNRGVCRLTDYYPDYYYGAQWNQLQAADQASLGLNSTASGTIWASTNNQSCPNNANYTISTTLANCLGYPRYVYRPSAGNWYYVGNNYNATGGYNSTAGGTIDSVFLEENYFLTEAQCYIARLEQSATVYTIGYQTNATETPYLQGMANNNGNNVKYYSSQYLGQSYNATTGTVSAVFQLIASKIAVSITH